MCGALGGCTTEQAYASVRNAQRQQCLAWADGAQRQRCLQDADITYPAYQEQVQRIKPSPPPAAHAPGATGDAAP